MIEIGQYVYLDIAPMTTSAAEPLLTKSYNKRLLAKMGAFTVIKVSQTTVAIDNDRIRNAMSIERATEKPTARETSNGNFVTQSDSTNAERDQLHVHDRKYAGENVFESPREYSADCMVLDVVGGDNARYFLRH